MSARLSGPRTVRSLPARRRPKARCATPATWLGLCLLVGCAAPRGPAPTEAVTAVDPAAAQAAWVEAHGEEIGALAARADALATRRRAVLEADVSRRTARAELDERLRACLALGDEIAAYADDVAATAEAGGVERLPGLPTGWDAPQPAAAQAPSERCERLAELGREVEEAAAVEARAIEARSVLEGARRTAPAVAAVSGADAALREAVTDALFVRYLDALDGWQEAATVALRASLEQGTPAEVVAGTQAESDAAGAAVSSLNAAITLAIAGRSGAVSDTVAAAVKALKKLEPPEREAVLALFPPEVTPASPVLLQLIGDRI
jgi:hypothetical protein